MLGLMAPDYLEREFFCCGLKPFMRGVRDTLIALGYNMAHHHQESFAADVPGEADAVVTTDVTPNANARAEFTSGVTARCTQTDTVLAMAKRFGNNIPAGCTFGLCGTCKIRKLSGEVQMVHNGGIFDDTIGMALSWHAAPSRWAT